MSRNLQGDLNQTFFNDHNFSTKSWSLKWNVKFHLAWVYFKSVNYPIPHPNAGFRGSSLPCLCLALHLSRTFRGVHTRILSHYCTECQCSGCKFLLLMMSFQWDPVWSFIVSNNSNKVLWIFSFVQQRGWNIK